MNNAKYAVHKLIDVFGLRRSRRRHLASIESSSTNHDAYLFSTSIGDSFHAELRLRWQIKDKSSSKARDRQV